MESIDLSKLTKEDFDGYLNQSLQIVFSDAIVTAELTEVVKMDTYSPLDRSSFYIIINIGTDFPQLRQGTYRLSLAENFIIDVFMVPIGPDNKGHRYQIIFS